MTVREKRNETLKKRYQVYRKLGYDSRTSRALSQRSLDVSNLKISKQTGKLKQNTVTKQYIETDMRAWKRAKAIDNYSDRMSDIPNDTVYSRHSMLTHDRRYRGETGKIIQIIKNENKLSTDQAYYFFYIMNQSNMTYNQTKKQLLSNKEFEAYDARKKARIAERKKQSAERRARREKR
jgi:hypothetical protein